MKVNKFLRRALSLVFAVLMSVTAIGADALTADAADYTISQAGIDFIKAREGFSAKCYRDGSQSSIGYGTKCGTTVHDSGLHSITREEAEKAMRDGLNSNYVPKVRNQTSGLQMTQNQFDALVSLCYNTGGGTSIIKNSPLCKYLRGELTKSDAISQYADYYVYSGGVKLQGLINRRKAEAEFFFSGSDPDPVIGRYRVTANSGLYVRQAPNTSAKIVGGLVKNTEFDVYEVTSGNWGRMNQGYVCLDYAERLTPPVIDTVIAKYKVTASSGLYIRQEPNTSAKIVGGLTNGTIFEIFEIRGNWGRSKDGWSCLDYAVKVWPTSCSHSWSSWSKVSDSQHKRTCSVCGATETADHNATTIPGKSATCTETGLTDGSKCSVCGTTLKAQTTIPVIPHKETIIPGKAATCTKSGLTDGIKCSVCNKVLKEHTVIPAKGHSETPLAGKAPTCTQTGLTDGVVCSVCKLVIMAQQTIPATGHKLGEWTVIKEATSSQEGIERRTCTNNGCSYYEERKIEKTTEPETEPTTQPVTEPTTRPDEPTTIPTEAAKLTADDATAKAGSTVRIPVRIENNKGLSYMRIVPNYDSSVFEFVGADKGTLGFDVSAAKAILLEADADISGDGVIFTLEFKVKEGVNDGDKEIKLTVMECLDEDGNEVGIVKEITLKVRVASVLWGDVNGDLSINGKDLILLRKYLSNYDDETGKSTVEVGPGADCNADGTCTGKDLVLLRRYLVNFDDETGLSTVKLGPKE